MDLNSNYAFKRKRLALPRLGVVEKEKEKE